MLAGIGVYVDTNRNNSCQQFGTIKDCGDHVSNEDTLYQTEKSNVNLNLVSLCVNLSLQR